MSPFLLNLCPPPLSPHISSCVPLPSSRSPHFASLSAPQVPGLYRGAASSFLGVSLESSLLFGTYTQMKRVLMRVRQPDRCDMQCISISYILNVTVYRVLLYPRDLGPTSVLIRLCRTVTNTDSCSDQLHAIVISRHSLS